MSLHQLTRFEIARVVIEAKSPFLIGVSDGDGVNDATFATDANGLPTIPGESLAGVLRHALAADGTGDPNTDPACQRAFGFQSRDDGAPSAVEISWAQVHDQHDRPVPFMHADVRNDPVLRHLAAGVVRDHVRLNRNGVAADTGKFDVRLVPAGARFTFELKVLESAGVGVDKLLQLLSLPETMIGRAGRRGLGEFRIVRAHRAAFDLTSPDDRRAFSMLPVPLHENIPNNILQAFTPSPVQSRWRHGRIRLRALSSWYVGGVIEPDGLEGIQRTVRAADKTHHEETASWDRFPLSEKAIVWSGGAGQETGGVQQRGDWLLPGSSLKGALRHRMGFYARLARGLTFDPNAPDTLQPARVTPQEEERLFGGARDSTANEGLRGHPGRIRIGDARVSSEPQKGPKQANFEHVSIDRFTQGPIDGRLFNEATLFQGPELEVEIAVDVNHLETAEPHLLNALGRALDDVTQGRLPLGAASSRGHGLFKGTIEWDDGQAPWEGV